MNIRTFQSFVRTFSVSLAFAVIVLFVNEAKSQTMDDPKETTQKFSTALQIIEFAYVDSIDGPDLTEAAIVAMLKKLDPHSAYISTEEVERVNEPLEGSFDGIGVTFQIFEDTIIVISPVPGGPSDKLGILAGDKILKIEGVNATGKEITNDFVMKRLRGPKGSTVNISIKRYGKNELIDYSIVRDKIPLNSIDAAYMVTPKIGLIKLTRFSKTSMEEFDESLAKLKEQGMKSLILDLRGNSGGYLDVAVRLSDEFLTAKKLIVYTEGLRSPRQDYNATATGNFELGKLVVLINEGSASASEIVSGAVQDWDRGLIVGRRSFGKGLVQRPFKLPDNSMIRLTTARYHTPTGRCIQKPYEEGSDEYQQDFKHRLESGELVSADSIKFPDSLKYFTPSKRVVYGGGGIMPDVFTPIDSTRFSDYYSDLVRKSVFNNFVISYLDKNRATLLEKFPDLESYKQNFIINDEIYTEFTKKAADDGISRKPDDKYYYPDEKLKIQIKAMLARNLWDINAYFEVITPIDDELIKAITLIEDGKMFNELKLR